MESYVGHPNIFCHHDICKHKYKNKIKEINFPPKYLLLCDELLANSTSNLDVKHYDSWQTVCLNGKLTSA
jgi:hypothetical protein